ncbi:hypothetical protein EV2_029459 [Malus domestica]
MGFCSLGFRVKLDVYFVEYGLWFEDSGFRIRNLGWVQVFEIGRVSSWVCSGLGWVQDLEVIGRNQLQQLQDLQGQAQQKFQSVISTFMLVSTVFIPIGVASLFASRDVWLI